MLFAADFRLFCMDSFGKYLTKYCEYRSLYVNPYHNYCIAECRNHNVVQQHTCTNSWSKYYPTQASATKTYMSAHF